MDGSIEKLLLRLEAAFDAAVAKDEESAAADLARSFDRGLGFRERLCASGAALELSLPDGIRLKVSVIAEDYFACGDPEFMIGRLDRAGFIFTQDGSPPTIGHSTFAQALRRWSDGAPRVEVATTTGKLSGRLLLAGPDHLVLGSMGGRILLPLAAVERLRLARED